MIGVVPWFGSRTWVCPEGTPFLFLPFWATKGKLSASPRFRERATWNLFLGLPVVPFYPFGGLK